MFGKQERIKTMPKVNQEIKEAVLESSICTGEKTLGIRNQKSGKLEQVIMVKDEKDINEFCKQHGIRKENIKGKTY